jgi:hypothetical protein
MSAPAPAEKEAPVPAPPSFAELLELCILALVNAPGVFERLAARPSPRPGASFLAALAWGVAFFALNLVHIAISTPGRLNGFAPWQYAAVAAAGLAAWTALYLLGSAFVYGLGRALGSEGGFDRALLVAAATLAAAPAQALMRWAPLAWFAPALIAGWIASCGLRSLFKADPWAAGGVCAVLAAGVLALQFGAGVVMERYGAAASFAAAAAQGGSPAQLADLQKQMQEGQAIIDAVPPMELAKPGQSSLDLLRVDADGDAPPAGPTQLQELKEMKAKGDAVSARSDALSGSVVNMLSTLEPMLNSPAITQNMSIQQKSDYKELKGLISTLKGDIASKKHVSPKDQQDQMLKIQRLLMGLMAPGAAAKP